MNVLAAFVGGFFFWLGCMELKQGMVAVALAMVSKPGQNHDAS